jgi:hypothetical protein
MSVLRVRNAIESFLNESVRIDAWDLDNPSNVATLLTVENQSREYPANAAYFDPVADLYYEKDGFIVKYTGIFRYYITYRFHRDLSKYQLPVKQLEALQEFLIATLLSEPGRLGIAVNSIGVEKEEYPLYVRRIIGEDSDWLITIVLPLMIKAIADTDPFDDIQPPTGDEIWEVDRITLDIYKRPLDGSEDDLDRELVLEIS